MFSKMNRKQKQGGMSLIELMVAIAIGAILLAGLATIFFNSSRSQRELTKSGEMIENGRYAIYLLGEDLRHVGYFGQYYDIGVSTGTLPDPCTTDTTTIEGNMAQPLSGYTAPDESTVADITSTTCDDIGLLPDDNLEPGSDVLVVMRADTSTSNTTTKDGDIYIQANFIEKTVFEGDGSAPPSTYLKYPTTAGVTTVADTRQFHVFTYFVAPCVIGNGTDGVCDGSEEHMPTLKRLELSTDGSSPEITITPLVEGVDKMLVQYGIDNIPNTADPVTGQFGDGSPDEYKASPSSTEWPDVISARIFLLVQAPKTTDQYSDTKQYTMAGLTFGPYYDAYKRHIFTTEIRPVNLAGRREIPH